MQVVLNSTIILPFQTTKLNITKDKKKNQYETATAAATKTTNKFLSSQPKLIAEQKGELKKIQQQ